MKSRVMGLESEKQSKLVAEIKNDYIKRKEERRGIEQSWLLNMNFVVGNQFSYINSEGEVVDIERANASESREVFNHIAPIIESRLAKLGRVRPTMGVRPSSSSESDLETAKLSKKILNSVSTELNLSNVVADATIWSEVAGTSFYKIVWNPDLGNVVGYLAKSGKVYPVDELNKFRRANKIVRVYFDEVKRRFCNNLYNSFYGKFGDKKACDGVKNSYENITKSSSSENNTSVGFGAIGGKKNVGWNDAPAEGLGVNGVIKDDFKNVSASVNQLNGLENVTQFGVDAVEDMLPSGCVGGVAGDEFGKINHTENAIDSYESITKNNCFEDVDKKSETLDHLNSINYSNLNFFINLLNLGEKKDAIALDFLADGGEVGGFTKAYSKLNDILFDEILTEIGSLVIDGENVTAKAFKNAKSFIEGFSDEVKLDFLGELEAVTDGDIDITVCSPFEIFPENAGIFEIDNQPSIMHVRAVTVDTIKQLYGVEVKGETINSVSLCSAFGSENFLAGKSNVTKVIGSETDNQVLLIERWVKPNSENKCGRLSIVAGDKLVFDGAMPYENYPFVKQVSNRMVGSFWGVGVVDRCIPIQRAYNAIKNRKLECVARLCGGVLAVEEGSVDVDSIEEDGLAPGKILVYRNGSNVPMFMDAGSVPRDLSEEEERLSNELISISGVSELMRNSTLPSQVNSGTAINLLIEQDDTRLSVTAENIRVAMLELSKRILRLYKTFATNKKLAKVTDECGRLQIFYWSKSDIGSDDVVLETSNELNESMASRKQMVLELLKYGLLVGENGKMDERTRAKVIEMLGFGSWESSVDEVSLQLARAKNENVASGDMVVLEVDNHDLHIREHTKYLLELGEVSGERVERLIEHIRMHKTFKSVKGE